MTTAGYHIRRICRCPAICPLCDCPVAWRAVVGGCLCVLPWLSVCCVAFRLHASQFPLAVRVLAPAIRLPCDCSVARRPNIFPHAAGTPAIGMKTCASYDNPSTTTPDSKGACHDQFQSSGPSRRCPHEWGVHQPVVGERRGVPDLPA